MECNSSSIPQLQWWFNSRPSAAYMRQWMRSTLVQIMAWNWIGIISSNAALLSIGPLGTNFSEILVKIQNFSFTKMHLKISSAKWRPFCPKGDELTAWNYWLDVNSLWPRDAIWRWRSWSTLFQVMACCLTAPSHYLNQCWLIIS